VLLALSAPLWALIWIEARASGKGSVTASEVRVGRTRRRQERRAASSRPLIDRRAAERRSHDLLGQPFVCKRFRTDIGPISRWMARHRLDKIPFLLSVLRHDMTLVGPKPEKEDRVRRWQGVVPDYARRFTVQPGVTGLAQVSDCSESDIDGVVRRVHYDLYYIDNRSLLLDVRTLGRTLGVVLRRPRPIRTRDPRSQEGHTPVAPAMRDGSPPEPASAPASAGAVEDRMKDGALG
jgi:lipopolysaccharide/colanic/teichoic acid biosynthesis glycosyltransferase